MSANEALIARFYTCFQQKDYAGMQACYADNATFSDAVFKNLNASQVRAMWQMLITRGTDLDLTFSKVQANDQQGSAQWEATYTFSATGRRVVNRIKAEFVFENGKIVQHTDSFDFYVWARQALGLSGWLLGWTSFLQQKVSDKAMSNLAQFMKKG
ncbi:MAG: nuclear transport factor 2 family protein [Spirosomataceae bacterium]